MHNYFALHFSLNCIFFFQRDLLSNDVISSWQKVIDMLSMIITLFFTTAFHINITPLFPYWFRCSIKTFTRRYWLVKAILIRLWCWFTPRVFTQNFFLHTRLKRVLKSSTLNPNNEYLKHDKTLNNFSELNCWFQGFLNQWE